MDPSSLAEGSVALTPERAYDQPAGPRSGRAMALRVPCSSGPPDYELTPPDVTPEELMEAEPPDPSTPAAAEATLGHGYADVLVVDDDEDLCEALVQVLSEDGYRVVAEAEAGRVDATIRSRRPRVVLLDLSLPGLDVAGVVRTSRELPSRGTHVVLLSGRDDAAALVERLGLDGLLRKPAGVAEVLAAVRAHARGARSTPH